MLEEIRKDIARQNAQLEAKIAAFRALTEKSEENKNKADNWRREKERKEATEQLTTTTNEQTNNKDDNISSVVRE